MLLKYFILLGVLGFQRSYATLPSCHNVAQQSQLAALNERMNEMIQTLYSSPFLSSIAKTKTSLRSHQSANEIDPEPSPPAPPFPISSFPPHQPFYPQPSQQDNSNVVYISPKTAAPPPSVTISRTTYTPAEYRYQEYREPEHQPSKPVDLEAQRREYYKSYYQYSAPTVSTPESPAYDYNYYYPESERPVRVAAQPNYSHAPSTPQVPVAPNYPPPPAAYPAPPASAYPVPSAAYPSPCQAYAPQVPPNSGYVAPVPTSPGYASSAYPVPGQAPPTYAAPAPPSPTYAAPTPPAQTYSPQPVPESSAYLAPVPSGPTYAAPVPVSPYPAPALSSAYAPPGYAGQEYYPGYYA